jgi:uncharacterized lipoprotein YbaY
MSIVRPVVLLLSVVAFAGCKNVAPETDQPAVIVNPDSASRAALQAAVNGALQTDVALADDALTQDSLLVIERRIPQTVEGSDAGGRTMQAPIQFQLVLNGADCVLVDQRNQARTILADTDCAIK